MSRILTLDIPEHLYRALEGITREKAGHPKQSERRG